MEIFTVGAILPCVLQVEADLVKIVPSSSAARSTSFHLSAKSDNMVARVGSTIDLSCHTSEKWHLCSWRLPEGAWCDRLSSTKYQTACENQEKVIFQVEPNPSGISKEPIFPKSLRYLQRNIRRAGVDAKKDCSVTVVDLDASHGGVWKCMVKENIRSRDEWTEEVRDGERTILEKESLKSLERPSSRWR